MKRPGGAMVVAFVALSSSLAGVAAAGKLVTGNDIANRSISSEDIKRGAIGTKQVRNDSLLLTDIKKEALASLEGDRGPMGPQGPAGETGAAGADGAQGPQGPAGPFPEGNLPRGKTIKGVYVIRDFQTAAGKLQMDAYSFGFTLASAPEPHVIPSGAASTAECPGTAAAPEAQPGHLCVYENTPLNRTGPSIWDPATGTENKASRWGFGLQIIGGGSTDDAVMSYGSWAVTSP